MKRFGIIISTILVLLWIVSSLAAPAQNVAITYKVKGKVEYFKGGSKTAVPLTASTHLSDGDKIKTGADGYCFLIFVDDKTQIKIRENTLMTIAANRTGTAVEQTVNMDVGKIWTHVTKEGSHLKVVTPTSVASVKGTMWWTLVDENGRTEIIGLSGIVELLSRLSGQIVDVTQGNTGTSDNNGASVNPTTSSIPNPEGAGRMNTLRVPYRDAEGNMKYLVIEYEE